MNGHKRPETQITIVVSNVVLTRQGRLNRKETEKIKRQKEKWLAAPEVTLILR